MTRSTALLLAIALAGCGGQMIRVPDDQLGDASNRADADGEARADADGEARADADGDEPDDGDRDLYAEAEAEGEDEPSGPPIELGEPVGVPGTGITMRPPLGAEAVPFAAGYRLEQPRVEIQVIVQQGPEELLDRIRAGALPSAPTPEAMERVRVSGVDARVGYDVVRLPQGTLERSWLLAHDGVKALAILSTYLEADADRVRPAVQNLLRRVQWDQEAEIDASAALGIEIGPVDGFAASNSSSQSLVLLRDGASFPPEVEDAAIIVQTFPVTVPTEQIDEACGEMIQQVVPMEEAELEHEGQVEDGRLPGCERLATVESPSGLRLAAYRALMFHEGRPILVTGTVNADDLSEWQGRFFAAARTVRVAGGG